MYIKQDWIMQQIEMLIQFIARLIFHSDTVTYDVENDELLTDADMLHMQIIGLVGQGKICQAENMLFEQMEPGTTGYLKVALNFYHTINKFSDEELERWDFSREEVHEGMREAARRFGVVIPEI